MATAVGDITQLNKNPNEQLTDHFQRRFSAQSKTPDARRMRSFGTYFMVVGTIHHRKCQSANQVVFIHCLALTSLRSHSHNLRLTSLRILLKSNFSSPQSKSFHGLQVRIFENVHSCHHVIVSSG